MSKRKRNVETVQSVAVVEDCLTSVNTSEALEHPEILPLNAEEQECLARTPKFRPMDCVQCTTKRPTRSSYSRVYCTKGNTRYIRCGWGPCGAKYKQVEELH